MTTSMGFATCFLAANKVYGNVFDVEEAETFEPQAAEKWPKDEYFIIDVQSHFTNGYVLPFREMVFAILGPTWMVGFLIVAIRLSLFRCPRCRHPFFRVWWFNNPLARKCMHCRLPKWSDTDPDDKRKT